MLFNFICCIFALLIIRPLLDVRLGVLNLKRFFCESLVESKNLTLIYLDIKFKYLKFVI